MLVLHRPIEYDTFMDPANPLTAGAQVLFGAITNVVAGFLDAPKDIVSDVVSAVRATRHPRERFDRRAACRAAISSLDETSPENSIESEESPLGNEAWQTQVQNDGQGAGENRDDATAQADTDDEDNEDHVNEIARVQSIERKRNLQLDKAKTMKSSMTPSKPPKFIVLREAASYGSKISKKCMKVIVWLPADFSLGMARGFHNAPKLYHDPTVIDAPQVVGLQSGFSAAGKELRDGIYFSITGIGTHPRDGFKNEGAKGLFKGIGKAMGGLLLKPTAGMSHE
ncbi:UDP-glucuronosyl/UDP-glucosyltransferase [Penicillium citrinum]|uniref:UDP-glucuronosyl/UDP-glucosyltransferase n=1 Tax=Penicillium citrinum TaxID=5077 RepID=A0A9W9TL40_PENCI|nr:UDP-glucuronosyl/UDP-glucosyltransferase [Penicillium citrinum]KAJ5226776.1 UDP-glucuronosyl/UDP-glucosyltransferase [Penicillium citrinum]